MKFSIQLFICLLLLTSCLAQSDDHSTVKALVEKIIDNTIATDKEKALLVTDREIYRAGETVYFKAFLVDSIHNYLRSTPSKLYVDCVDEKDSLIATLLLNNAILQTSGQFVLPDSLPEGFYWMRAFTKEMISVNLKNIAVLPIYVFGKARRQEMIPKTVIKDSTNAPVLQLYPEGGAIISGLNSTVGVSVKNGNGSCLIVDGILKDNHDSTVSTFTTNKYGLAKFSFFPKWFGTYKILLKRNNVYDSIDVLPKINFYAAQVAVTQQSNRRVTIRVTLEDSVYSKDYTTYLIGINKDSLCFARVGKGMYSVTIPRGKFPAGITTLYLFNNKNELLSTRDIYIRKENYDLSVRADKKNYAAREKVKLNFKVTDTNNQPEIAAFSLSVVDKNLFNTNGNFFQTDTLHNLSPENADLIMLTQSKKSNPFYSVSETANKHAMDTNFILSGRIATLKNNPLQNDIVTILSANPAILAKDTSDSNGMFTFHLPGYYDSTHFIIQLNNPKGKSIDNFRIVFNTNSPVTFSTPAYLKTTFALSDSLQSIKRQLAISDSAFFFEGKHWLKPVIVKSYKPKEVNYDVTKRVSSFSYIITRDQIGVGSNTAGFAILRTPGGMRLFSGMLHGEHPLVVVDGSEIPEAVLKEYSENGNPVIDFINSIPVSTIDFIEILAGPEAAAYSNGGNGVILINTRSGGSDSSLATPLKSFYAKGFCKQEPFEMPDYSNPQLQNLKMQDLRKTIYWNGNIVTDKNGEASVEFFAADEATTYIGVITGVTINGDKIYQTFTISRN